MGRIFTETVVEDAALTWFYKVGCVIAHGPEIAPEEPAADPPGARPWLGEPKWNQSQYLCQPTVWPLSA